MKVRQAAIAGGLAVALVLLAACGGGDDDQVNADDRRAVAEAAATKKVGEVGKLGDVEITVHGFKDPFDSGNPVVKPAAGTRHVAADVEVKNLSSKPVVFSGFSQFQLKDSTNKSYTAIPLPRQVPSIGGEAPPGGSFRGMIAYQIPEGTTGLRLVFENPLVTEGSVTFALT